MPQTKPTPIDDAPDLCRLGARALAQAYADGSLSPVEATRAALERAATAQERFNAFSMIDADTALAAAAASEARWKAGAPLSPVDGVPSTIKDIVSVKGWPARYGSTTTDAAPKAEDAPAVARLRAAGLVFLGMTTTPEFGWKALTDCALTGITRNPWNPEVTPGGSSGGAAAAAACGAGVFHLGSDGGGSIRVPSAFTGICGIKPTFGRVPAYPASPFGTVAHVGPMTRRPDDMGLMLDVMSGRDRQDWLQGEAVFPGLDPVEVSFAGLRIGYWKTPPSGTVDPEIAARIDREVAALAAAGAIVEEIALPMSDRLLGIFNTHWYAGAANRLAGLPAGQRAAVDPGMVEMADTALTWSIPDYLAAVTARADYGAAMDTLLGSYDFLVSPGAAVLPFKAGEEVPPGSGLPRWIEWAGFSYPINLSQQPAACLPAGLSESGLPIALQVIAGRGRDADVIGFAKAYGAAHPDRFL
ncbi:amidase [Paroceanicella profunda]|uniref:Amidase n=1 Tax=Paroceanicella profunda TaxID=2579971 RepID=A0A5B8G3I3_9RHOB|nr:amidase [Paroceanicella profunda]QDL93343.1 amidase [Paroceanicella profunda]